MGLIVLKSLAEAVTAPAPVAHSAPRTSAPTTFDAVLMAAAIGLLADLILYRLILLTPPQAEEVLVRPFFYRMDTPVLLIAVATLLALRFLPVAMSATGLAAHLWSSPALTTALAATIVVVIGWFGASHVMLGIQLSRDEQMAVLDAQIIAGGSLMAPITPEWRSYAEALQFLFTQFADGFTHWSSVYYPLNALVRSLFLRFGAADLANPAISACAVWFAYDVARKLWPDRRDAGVVAALIVTASAQVLVTAMTPYAMSLHLALTLLWLRFWLRNDAIGHAGAITTGFCAVGVHQMPFHPIFVAPFVLSLWLARRWRIAILYTLAYAAIGITWLSYWKFAAWTSGAVLPVAVGGGASDLVDKIVPVLKDLSIAGFLYVPLFLLKFFAWQHILLLPLLLAAASAWRAMPQALRLSLAAAALTLAIVFVIMPYQGHGWGYRYLHGFIGPIALVAAYGWTVLSAKLEQHGRQRLEFAFAAATAVTLLASMPVLALELRRYVAPYQAAEMHLKRQPVDVVVIDHLGSRGGSLIANEAHLANRPKIMALAYLDDGQIRALCAKYSVAFFGIEHMRAFGLDAFDRSVRAGIARTLDHRREVMREAGCRTDVPLP